MSTLILVRHAHRDLSDRSADNGLSKKGRAQSRRILADLADLKERFGKKHIVLLSSPKRRCVETLEPTAQYLKIQVRISDLLTECEAHESPAAFRSRIRRALREIHTASPKGAGVTVLCSHGDWLPLALKQLCGADADIRKGGLAEIQDGTLVRLL